MEWTFSYELKLAHYTTQMTSAELLGDPRGVSEEASEAQECSSGRFSEINCLDYGIEATNNEQAVTLRKRKLRRPRKNQQMYS